MLVVENFLLLALDPKLGVASLTPRSPSLEKLCAAALLIDLADIGQVSLRGNILKADMEFPVTHPLLRQALSALGSQPQSPAAAMDSIARRMRLPARVAEGLCRRDILHRFRNRYWFLFRPPYYPLRSVQARNTAIDHLRIASREATSEPRGLALLFLLDVAGTLPRFIDAHDHEAAEHRLLALNSFNVKGNQTMQILAAVRGALLDG